jgi:hypothetical protein
LCGLPLSRPSAGRKLYQNTPPVPELCFHGCDFRPVAFSRLSVRFFLDFDDQKVGLISSATVNDDVGEYATTATTTAAGGKIEILRV